MKNKTYKYIGLLACLVLAGCQDKEDFALNSEASPAQYIQIGGVDTDELIAAVTRGQGDPVVNNEEEVQLTDAENISWLVTPLTNGLDITYGKEGNPRTNERVAVLKLLTEGDKIKYSEDPVTHDKVAEYSFLYRNNENGNPTENPAIWYDNGAHYFEGLYIPTRIKYRNEAYGSNPAQTITDVYGTGGSAPNLNTDQHDDNTDESSLGNYTLLSRYLGMPSKFTLNATVARVKLPFRHRLARVLAYILIDPDMGNDVKIQGYSLTNGKDDPTTSAIKFCNVKVLAGVKDSYNATTQHHTYIPQWTQVRKAIPHFVGERGSYDDSQNQSLDNNSFIAYYDTQKKEYIYPTDAAWNTIRSTKTFPDGNKTMTEDKAYERTIYGMVPVYDMIVQPTYTTLSSVMYDEEGVDNETTRERLYVATNQIEFEVTLNNGLNYSKVFTFDLDANYQTVVYLRISRERVDYNSSGSDRWVETTGYDDYYGVNNQNGNTLSLAGSGWQRAYTNSETNYNVTDGHQYLHDSEDEEAQYVTDAKWIEMFAQAYQGGAHHGDYFILANDMSIPASALPDNFVFTGHLDGMDHTITLTGTSYDREVTAAYDEDTYVAYDDASETKYVKTGETSYEEFNPGETTYYSLGKDEYDNEVYTAIVDMAAFNGSSIYTRSGEAPNYNYTAITLYKKVIVHHDAVIEHIDRGYLLNGLYGNYTTAQETDPTATWEANVHKEGSVWVPYKTDTDGWRAEIINTNVNGGTVFPATVNYGTQVTGYVHNCWEGSTYNSGTHKWSGGNKVTDYTPSIPEY